MALTKISTGGVKDDAASQAKIADEAIDEARLQISNAGSNGQFLQKQSGNTGGLTWAAANEYTHPNHSGEVTSTADGAQVIASNVVDEDNLKISNSGTNGQFLQKQSGNTGGLTWADVTIPPAGNTVDLVADGAIAAGKPVIIKTNGKVAQAAQTTSESTSQASSPAKGSHGIQMNANADTNKFPSVVFSETSNIGCSFFNDGGSGQTLKGRYWNINSSGNANIPSASNTAVYNAGRLQIDSCWDSTNNKFFIAGKSSSDNKVHATWVTVSSSGITASGNTFELVGVQANHPKCIDCGSGRIAVAYNVDWSSGGVFSPYVHMLDWNGSSNYQTSGGHTEVDDSGDSSNPGTHIDIAWHASESKIIAVYHNGSNAVGCKIGTITGTAGSYYTSWGSEVTVASGAELPKVVVDVNTGKVVVTYVYTSNDHIYSKVGTISGTSISFGSEVRIGSSWGAVDANQPSDFRPELIYVKQLQKVLYGHVRLASSNYYTETVTGTVSGTSISWANNFKHWSNGVGIRGVTMCDLNDSATHKVVIGGRNDANSDKGEFKTIALSSAVTNVNTNTNIIGFAEDAINDTATGTVKLYGNVVGNQSSLTAGTLYYHKPDGSLSTAGDNTIGNLKAGMALSATKLLIYNPLT